MPQIVYHLARLGIVLEGEPVATPVSTKRDTIIDQLRRLILSGEVARGERLPQDELATRFQSSITPVREALRALEAEGLVVSEPHRGTRVAAVDFERVKATYIVRRLAESYAIRRATTRLSARDLRRAENLLLDVEAAAATGDVLGTRQANRAYHFFFYDRCGIPALADHIATLWAAFPWDLVLDTSERFNASEKEHREIQEAVRAGDPDAASLAVEQHIQQGFAALTYRLTGEEPPDPFDPDID